MTTELTKADSGKALTIAEIKSQINLIQEVMRAVMKPNVHYGVIPGTQKPTLYKPGSEAVLSAFRISVDPESEDLSNGDEAKYRVRCYGRSMATGTIVGIGIGEASSNEEKYKWRAAVCDEEFDATPEDRRRTAYKKGKGGGHYTVKQVRTNPADVANTILKMAKKRAQIDMTLTATACSDVFDQDLEDLPPGIVDHGERQPVTMPTGKTEHVKPDGDIARGLVGQVSEKKLPSGKMKYGIQVDGKWYGTFSSTDAGVARDAKMQGKPVALAWLKNGDFYNVASINVEDAAPLTDAKKAEIETIATAAEEPGEDTGAGADAGELPLK
jgi:hypothetical protein